MSYNLSLELDVNLATPVLGEINKSCILNIFCQDDETRMKYGIEMQKENRNFFLKNGIVPQLHARTYLKGISP